MLYTKPYIYPLVFISLLFIGIICSCSNRKAYAPPTGDTVAAEKFKPIHNDTIVQIDLAKLTGLAFPKYKIQSEEPIIPDSISISADEETVMGGNYSAMLLLDSIPGKDFYTAVNEKAANDTCWKITAHLFSYIKQDSINGRYEISFYKGSQQITVKHLNYDLVKKKAKINPDSLKVKTTK